MPEVGTPVQLQLEKWDEAYVPNPDDADPAEFHQVVCFTFADVMLRRSEALLSEPGPNFERSINQAIKHKRNAVELLKIGAKGDSELEKEVEEIISGMPTMKELMLGRTK